MAALGFLSNGIETAVVLRPGWLIARIKAAAEPMGNLYRTLFAAQLLALAGIVFVALRLLQVKPAEQVNMTCQHFDLSTDMHALTRAQDSGR
jgi:hypothetical protein